MSRPLRGWGAPGDRFALDLPPLSLPRHSWAMGSPDRSPASPPRGAQLSALLALALVSWACSPVQRAQEMCEADNQCFADERCETSTGRCVTREMPAEEGAEAVPDGGQRGSPRRRAHRSVARRNATSSSLVACAMARPGWGASGGRLRFNVDVDFEAEVGLGWFLL